MRHVVQMTPTPCCSLQVAHRPSKHPGSVSDGVLEDVSIAKVVVKIVCLRNGDLDPVSHCTRADLTQGYQGSEVQALEHVLIRVLIAHSS